MYLDISSVRLLSAKPGKRMLELPIRLAPLGSRLVELN